jgi:hypothetical protein
MSAFSIRASRSGQSVLTIRIDPTATIAKAHTLQENGWTVQITDSDGRVFELCDFEVEHRRNPESGY